MNNEHGNKLEQRVRFVAKRYREGSLDPDKAWQKFASEHAISRKVSFRRYWIGAKPLSTGFGAKKSMSVIS